MEPFGISCSALEASGTTLGGRLARFWEHLEGFWRVFGDHFRAFGASLKRFAAILKNLQKHCKVLQKSRFGGVEIHGKLSLDGKLGPKLELSLLIRVNI